MEYEFASVLIVNFNGAAHLPACLTSLKTQSLPRHKFEVVLVDNASSDGSVDLVRAQFAWVRLVTMTHNVGFAEGTNIAARLARGRVLVLLNNDTIPDPFWLEELLRATERCPDQRAASKLVFVHDPRLLNSTGLFLLRDGRGADRGFRQPDRGQFEECGPVFTGCGAAIAVPTSSKSKDVLEPKFFLYYEDLDAGWQAQLAGRSTEYTPRSLVRHIHGAAAGERSTLFHFHVERNRALTAVRNGDGVLAARAVAVLVAKAARAAFTAARSPVGWPVARAVTAALLSFMRHLPRTLLNRWAIRSWARVEASRCGS